MRNGFFAMVLGLASGCGESSELPVVEGGWVSDRDTSSPELAWQVGPVDESPGYIGGDIEQGDVAYFLFEAATSFEIRLHVQNAPNGFEHIHLYEALDDSLGSEVEPGNYEVLENGLTGWYEVEQGHSYYFEIHVPGGGFF